MDGSKRPWTDDEYGFIADHPTWTARQIGEALGRGMQAVQHKRNDLRLGVIRVERWWDEDDIQFVRSTPHFTAQQVANHLGRSVSSVRNRRALLVATERLSFDTSDKHSTTLGTTTKDPHHVGHRLLLARTCVRCGKFLSARYFNAYSNKSQRGGRRTWPSHCFRCETRTPAKVSTNKRDGGRSARESAAKLQAITKDRATRVGQPWVDADHSVLRNGELTIFEKAVELGRTYLAVKTVCSVNGYVSKVGRGDPVSGEWRIYRLEQIA